MRHNFQLLRLLAVLPLALCGPPHVAPALDQPANRVAPIPEGFQEFLQGLWPLAEEKGIARGTFDSAFAGLTPDPAAPAASNRQAEFDKPLKSYLDEAVSPRRIARGQECLRAWRAELSNIEQRFGVPAGIILAAYGVETDFGKAKGEKDVVRSLATLAYRRRDRPVFRDELISALVMLDHGGVARAVMKGSWAGAMGGPQFLPSAFLKYAVSYTGRGSPDIWRIPSIVSPRSRIFCANPAGNRASPGERKQFCPKISALLRYMAASPPSPRRSVKSATGDAFPQGDATLFLPSGAAGPAFLLSANYWILKVYNNSDSYALSLTLARATDRGQTPAARPLAGGRDFFEPDAKG